MIPIKNAINLFEQYKIDFYRNNNPEPFEYEFSDKMDYKDKEVNFATNFQTAGCNGETLLSFIKKKYYLPCTSEEEFKIIGKLQLYGKKFSQSIDGINYNEQKYIKIYLNYYVDEIKRSDLFENYDYLEIYNHSTNYTVIGDRVLNAIYYMDISVDNKEFKNFLEELEIDIRNRNKK
jgi:hypothetical protein